ncbi:MAG TPA: hypothetical protein VK463_19995 [Desulfomonilaceae bacterium]|nr:hypothetical protein [Desulfomonilaceae bacterium]
MKMMDIRARIVRLLDQAPEKRFSVKEIAQKIGSNPKATTAALGRLVKDSRISRAQKGAYLSKATSVSEKPARISKTPEKKVDAMSIVSIDLLVEAEAPQVDVSQLREFAAQESKILDFKVRKIVPADRGKLKVRFTLPED